MKKLLSLMAIIFIALGITACSNNSEERNDTSKEAVGLMYDKAADPEEVALEIYTKMLEEWENNDYEGFAELYGEGVPEDYIKVQFDHNWGKFSTDFQEKVIKTLYDNEDKFLSVVHYYAVEGAYTKDYSYLSNNILLAFLYENNQWKLTNSIGKEFTKYDLLSEEAGAVEEENIYLATLRDYNVFTGFVIPGILEGTIKEIYLGEDGSYHITLTFSNGMKEEVNFKTVTLEASDAKGQEIINIAEHPINLLVKENSSSDFLITLPAPEGAGKIGEGIDWSLSYQWE